MTPSKLRRQGREAFWPDTDPSEICPYGVLTSLCNYGHWMDGWNEAQKEHLANLKEDADFESTFDNVMSELECEWAENNEKYTERRTEPGGIRSSQVCALVGLLIKKGILK